jgi:LTXXQ motif family protein
MPMFGLRHLSFLAVGLIALGLSSAAQAKHARHRLSAEDSSSEDSGTQGRRSHSDRHRHLFAQDSGVFAVGVAQLIGACNAQAAELRNMPFDAVIKAVQPNDTQLAAWQQIRAATATAAASLTASCPKDVPARPTDQLDTMRTTLNGIKASLSPLRPVLVNGYAALGDEQKARLVALALSQQVAPQADLHTGAVRSAADKGPQLVSLGCWQWAAMLKSWPLSKVESDMSLSDRQHAALYTLMASIYRAAVDLEASCHDENALTPVVRLDIEIVQLDTLRQGIDAIAPPLAEFVNTLNEQQNAELNVMLGVWLQPRQAAR